MGSEIIYSDATKLAELIRSNEVSPVEVVQAHLDRIGKASVANAGLVGRLPSSAIQRSGGRHDIRSFLSASLPF
jgi:hypothetical protein